MVFVRFDILLAYITSIIFYL